MSFLSVEKPALGHLASAIATHTRELEEYYETSQTPQPSFQKGGPSEVLPIDAPVEVHRARAKLADAAFKLYQLSTGPSEIMSTARANVSKQTLVRNGTR